MGLFDKKFCSVCGEKIGFLGNRKLEDGNLCKDCAKKLSPFFSERRNSTVDEIKQQLAYREENAEKVAVFHITRAIGSTMTVCLDEDQGRFLVASTRDLEEENPDVMEFSDVTGCHMDVEEHKTEIMREKPDGTKEHYFPPRYDTDYDLYVTINVNNPWFNEIRFRLNHSTIDQRGSAEFQNCQRDGNEIVDALTKARQNVRREAAAASAPKTAQTCPWCGATCIPDANGCCEYCGGAMKQ